MNAYMPLRLLTALCLALTMVALPACDLTPQSQVVSAYKKGEAAIENFNAEKFRETLCPESYTYYWETLKLAREGKAEQVRKLGPTQMGHVLRLRNRATKEQLQTMNVDEYFVWLIDNGGMVVDKEYGIYPVEVTIDGDKAVMQMGVEVEVEPRRGGFGRRGMATAAVRQMLGGNKQVVPIDGLVYAFRKIDGQWLMDHTATDRAYDALLKREADDAGKSVMQHVADEEEAGAGKIKPNIWDPPFRTR